MNRLALSFAAVLLCSAAAHAQPVPWNLDPAHSHIGFTARHLAFAKVHGEFKKFSAKVEADAKTGKIVKLEAEADAKSIDTGVEKRDNHLRSDDFFGADKFPAVKLVVKDVKWKGKSFTSTVSLTLRDITKDVKFTGTIEGPHSVNFGQGPQQRAGYEAHAKINRKDFGLKFNGLAEGVALVSDDVEIDLEVEISMTPAPPAAPATPAAAAPAPATPAVKPAPAASMKPTPSAAMPTMTPSATPPKK
jgi:polyisoprenoid-binding protein YceI